MTSWNSSIESDTPPHLHIEAVWQSKRAPRFPLTVVTQLSVDRMPALFNQCHTFTGPIAAIVYLPLVEPVSGDTATDPSVATPLATQLSLEGKARVSLEVARIGHMWQEIEDDDTACQLDLMLIWEAFDSSEAALLYPVNTLRNLARMQVRTKLMSAIDVDMMISKSLLVELGKPEVVATFTEHALARRAVVIPAFEPARAGPAGRDQADRAAAGTKAELAELNKHKKLVQFKLKVFPRGHTPTNYTRWFGTSEDYPVEYKRMFEPWYIGHVDVAPFHDSNFRGYGLNKIAHVASLNYYGYTFVVYAGAWLVHRPHEDTAVRKMVANQASQVNKLGVRLGKDALYYKVTQLFGKIKRGMIKGDLELALDPAMVRCYGKLTWLPRIPKLEGRAVDPDIFV
ncbi:hypothetical protein FOA52_012669 [Chlamydomonas sp. UWO 241]|nr:hypothetical protein FOA52_012669 [Chlamydomonas sp. UWO 241]